MSQAVPTWLPEAAAATPDSIRPAHSLSPLSISLLTAAVVASASLGYTSWRVASLPAYDPNASMQVHDAAVSEVAQSDNAAEPTKLAVLDGTPANIISAAPAPVINAAYVGSDPMPQAIPLSAQTDDSAVANALHPEPDQPEVIAAGEEVAATPVQAENDDAPPPVPQGADAVLMPPNS